MPNAYQINRLEPHVRSVEVGGKVKDNVVVKLVVGMTGTAADGYQAYIDAAIPLTVDPDNFIEFADLDEAWAKEIADEYIAENNWKEVLDKQIEAKRLQPLPRPFTWQIPVEEPSE